MLCRYVSKHRVREWETFLPLDHAPGQRAEAILYGMAEASEFFGCVPRELWWDNPMTVATVILTGRQRTLHPRYQALASHYNFHPLFCMPARGNEKPHVENRVKKLQRRWTTRVPQLRDMASTPVHHNSFVFYSCWQLIR